MLLKKVAKATNATNALVIIPSIDNFDRKYADNYQAAELIYNLAQNPHNLPCIFGPHVDILDDNNFKTYAGHYLGLGINFQANNKKLAQSIIRKKQAANICLALYHDFCLKETGKKPPIAPEARANFNALSNKEQNKSKDFELLDSHNLGELKHFIKLDQEDIDTIAQKHSFDSKDKFLRAEEKRDYHFQFVAEYEKQQHSNYKKLKTINLYCPGSIVASSIDMQAQADIAGGKLGKFGELSENSAMVKSLTNFAHRCLLEGIEINLIAHSLGALNLRMLLPFVRARLLKKLEGETDNNNEEEIQASMQKFNVTTYLDLVKKFIPNPLELDGQLANQAQLDFINQSNGIQNSNDDGINLILWNLTKPENLLLSQMEVNHLTPQIAVSALDYNPAFDGSARHPNSNSMKAQAAKKAFDKLHSVKTPYIGDHGCNLDMRAFIRANYREIKQLEQKYCQDDK